MAWIESHQSVWTHRKTLELCDLLAIPETTAVGCLLSLRHWGLDNGTPDGDIGKPSPGVIARASRWTGNPQAWYDALLSTHWLDQNQQGLRLHDFYDYAGKYQKKLERDRQRKRLERAQNAQAPSSGSPQDGAKNHTDVAGRQDKRREESSAITGDADPPQVFAPPPLPPAVFRPQSPNRNQRPE